MSDQNKESLRPISMADSEKTAAQSVNPSVLDTKDVGSTMPSTAASMRETSAEPPTLEEKNQVEEKTSEQNSVQGSTSDPNADDDYEYPKAWKLAAITIALCLSVFCMALVCETTSAPAWFTVS